MLEITPAQVNVCMMTDESCREDPWRTVLATAEAPLCTSKGEARYKESPLMWPSI